MQPTNLFAAIPTAVREEVVQVLLARPGMRIERIVSQGEASPPGFWYDQNEHEFVVVLQGKARLRFADREVELNRGDWVEIPAHARHRVEWTDPDETTIWLALFWS